MIYHRSLQFHSSSQQILMCRLCGEHLSTSRENPNDPPTNTLEKKTANRFSQGCIIWFLKGPWCAIFRISRIPEYSNIRSEKITVFNLGISVPTFTPTSNNQIITTVVKAEACTNATKRCRRRTFNQLTWHQPCIVGWERQSVGHQFQASMFY